jgi:hypothetical protein
MKKNCLMDFEVAVCAWVLRLVESRDLPAIATAALSNGMDGQSLRELAGLSQVDSSDARPVFERVIRESGRSLPDRREAAVTYAKCLAQLTLAGEMTPRECARKIWTAASAVKDQSFHDLDPFVYAASEYDDRRGDQALFDTAILQAAQDLVNLGRAI